MRLTYAATVKSTESGAVPLHFVVSTFVTIDTHRAILGANVDGNTAFEFVHENEGLFIAVPIFSLQLAF
jgi:hypothetical protein